MGYINAYIEKQELVDEISETKDGLLPDAIEMVDDISNIFLNYLLPYTPIGETHQLYDQTVIQDTGTLSREIGSLAPESVFVIGGTDPHHIGAAVYIWSIGEWRYIGLSPKGKGKIHPGTTPNDYLLLAYMDGVYDAESRAETYLDKIVS